MSTSSTTTDTLPKRKTSLFSRFTTRNRTNSSASSSLPPPFSPGGRASSPSPSGLNEFGLQNGPPKISIDVDRKHPIASTSKIRHPKVKVKGKSTKEFGKLFLAQELFVPSLAASPPPPPQAARASSDSPPINQDASSAVPPPTSTSQSGAGGKKKNSVWSTKFSDDGRYLAVGGKDGIVRVWEVLSSPQDRKEATSSPSSSSFAGETPTTSPTFSTSPKSTSLPPNITSHDFATPASPTSPTSSKRQSSYPPPHPPSNGATTSPTTRSTEPVNIMPVFNPKPIREFVGHEADVLDLSWSKNNFLLSSSMDKTVRLWHVSREECLCAFQHLDFVTSISFHPRDDRFFLSGSLDCKLRLWNIAERRVQTWTELPELITSVAFTRDGKLAIAGTFNGVCMFFEVETFRYHAQFFAKSTRGKNSKGRKITSLVPFPLPSTTGERLLVTSNDSRVRLFHVMDKNVEAKYSGHENVSSQIRASFSDNGRYIISGSEDRSVYMWDSGIVHKDSEEGGWHLPQPLKKSEGIGCESFQLPASIITCASFAPSSTYTHLALSSDPIFSDGHSYLVPLRATLSGATLSAATTASSERLFAVRTGIEGGERGGGEGGVGNGARDAIVVVADDETGVISVFRNSELPEGFGTIGSPTTSKRNKRVSRSSMGH